jgi:hypothetical protein
MTPLQINLSTREILTTEGQALTEWRVKRRDKLAIVATFTDGGAAIMLPSGSLFRLAIKAAKADEAFLALASQWTRVGTGEATKYRGMLNLHTEPVRDAFEAVAAGEAEPDFIPGVAEVEIVFPNGEVVSTATVPVIIEQDVIHGDEGLPTPGNTRTIPISRVEDLAAELDTRALASQVVSSIAASLGIEASGSTGAVALTLSESVRQSLALAATAIQGATGATGMSMLASGTPAAGRAVLGLGSAATSAATSFATASHTHPVSQISDATYFARQAATTFFGSPAGYRTVVAVGVNTNADTASFIVSDFARSYLDDSSAAATRDTLGLGSVVTSISGGTGIQVTGTTSATVALTTAASASLALADTALQTLPTHTHTAADLSGVVKLGVSNLTTAQTHVQNQGSGAAIHGEGVLGTGVYGTNNLTGHGVYGASAGGTGVYGASAGGTGVIASSSGSGVGIKASSLNGNAAWFTAFNSADIALFMKSESTVSRIKNDGGFEGVNVAVKNTSGHIATVTNAGTGNTSIVLPAGGGTLSVEGHSHTPSQVGLTTGATGMAVLASADAAAGRTALELGSAATSESTAFATSAQGALADTALQPNAHATVADLTVTGDFVHSGEGGIVTESLDVLGNGNLTINGNPLAAQIILGFSGKPALNEADWLLVNTPMTIKQTDAGVAYAVVDAAASTTIHLYKNTTVVGTVLWSAAANSGTITLTADVSLAANDRITLKMDNAPDADLSDIQVALKGVL